jgi:CelD/BcsL family acetyltransferase involved in cellulose biosynthesis
MPVKTISLNTTGIAEYDRLVIEYNAFLSRSSSGCALKQILDSMPIEWEEFLLPWLDMSLCPGNCLQDRLRPYHVLTRKESPSYYVDLQKVRECNGDYLSLLGKNTRRQMRRTERRYSENGTVKLQVAATVDEGLKVYDEMVDLHRQTWKERGRDCAFNSDYFYSFHRNFIIKRFATGEIQLVKLTCGEETIGCLYNFVYEGKVYSYQSGFNYKGDKKMQPGYLTIAQAIIYNSTIGNLTYDFLAGDAKYKRSLSTDCNKLVWAAIQKPYFKFRVERLLEKLKACLKNKIKKYIR